MRKEGSGTELIKGNSASLRVSGLGLVRAAFERVRGRTSELEAEIDGQASYDIAPDPSTAPALPRRVAVLDNLGNLATNSAAPGTDKLLA
jgi:hypothetical protein